MSDEPYTSSNMFMNMSGVPVRVEQGGKNAGNVSVPAPELGDEDSVLTVQPDLSVAWEPAGGGGIYQVATVVFSNADLKTPNVVTLIPAQGAGTVIVPTQCVATCDVATGSVFTNAPTMQFRYNNSATGQETSSLGSFTFWTSANEPLYRIPLRVAGANDSSVFANQPYTGLLNAAATGNAANNKTVTLRISYWVATI